jgi:5'-nucleotidase
MLLATAAALMGCSTTTPAPTSTPPAPGTPPTIAAAPVNVRLLAFNDFHGHLEPGGNALNLPDPANPANLMRVATGGAAFLAGKLDELRAGQPHTVTLSSGDLIGASPLASSLFRDEPTIEVMNALRLDLNAVGNHEFDRGLAELRRLVDGGCAPNPSDAATTSCPDPARPYAGARFADGPGRGFLAANVVDAAGQPVLPPYAVRRFGGQRVGFIGVVTRVTPTIVVPSGVAGLRFLDEADTLNRYAAELEAQGVKAIVAMVHEGGTTRGSWNDTTCPGAEGPIFDIHRRLSPAIDVVFSAHSHQGYNCRIDGRIVIQAFSFGRGISQVDLVIDPATGDVDRALTRSLNVPVVNTGNPPDIAARFPPTVPDAGVQRLVAGAVQAAAPRAQRVIGRLASPLTRTPEATSGGDHPAGRFVADVQLAATRPPGRGGAQIAFMNPGGIRTDFSCPGNTSGPCDITFGAAFAAQPFGNSLVVMTLTGAQIVELLEQQATGVNAQRPRILQPSAGFAYTWAAGAPAGSRVRNPTLDERPLDPSARYRVVVNSFLAEGGDGFTVLTRGTDRLGGPQDLDAMVEYLRGRTAPVAPDAVPRVVSG